MKTINANYSLAKNEYNELQDKPSITKLAEKYHLDRHTLSNFIFTDKYSNYIYYLDDKLCCLDEREEQAVEEYIQNPELTFTDITKKYGYKSTLFKNKLKAKGYSEERRYLKSFNRNAFDEIVSEEDAYWLGFLLADGYVMEDRQIVILKLGERDREHLVKFCQYLNMECDIKSDKGGGERPVYYVYLSSKTLKENLINKGVLPNKSTKEQPYTELNQNLIKHYIRGLIDGDGFLVHGERNVFGFVGSKDIVFYVRNYINDNIIPLKLDYVYPHGKIFKLELTDQEIVKACYTHFYKDSVIYLDRKYQIVENYLNGRD